MEKEMLTDPDDIYAEMMREMEEEKAELLEALKNCTALLEKIEEEIDYTQPGLLTTIIAARAAIAKAESKTQPTQ